MTTWANVRWDRVRIAAQPVLLAAFSVLTAHGQSLFVVTSPAEGQVFRPGDVVQVSVASVPGISLQGVEVVSPIGWKVREPVGTIPLTIPATHSLGPVRLHILVATTSGGGGEIYRTIIVGSPGDLSYLSVSPQVTRLVAPNTSRLFAPLTTERLNVTGTLETGARFDMTADPQTTFTSQNSAVATVSVSGTISAVAPGQTAIVVRNGAEYASAVVQVNLFERRGDLDGDEDVDQDDLDVLARALNSLSTGTDDPRDLNSDGSIDSRDIDQLRTLCTRANCALNAGEASPATPSINQNGVVNAASLTVPVARGSIALLSGVGLSPVAVSAAVTPLPRSLEDVRVTVNGVDAPLFSVSPNQVVFQVPYETPARGGIPVAVSRSGSSSPPISISVSDYAPGIFTYQRTSTVREPIVQHQDWTLVTPDEPAFPGEALVVYATGIGALNNPPATGEVAAAHPLATSVVTPTVTVGGSPAQVLFAGLTPTLVGLAQINFVVPSRSWGTSSTAPLTVQFGSAASNSVNLNVAPVPRFPDLVVTSFTAPRTGTIGNRLTGMQLVVRNQGTGDAGPFRVGFYLSTSLNVTTSSIFTGWSCTNSSGLSAGSTWNCSGDIGIPSTVSAGTYSLGAIMDDLGQVAESNENNNVRVSDSGTVTLTLP